MIPGKLYKSRFLITFDKINGQLLPWNAPFLLPEDSIILFLGCDKISFGGDVTNIIYHKNTILKRCTRSEIFQDWFEAIS